MRLCWLRFVPVCLLVLAVGCGGRRTSVDYAEVSGTVKYKGKPVTGGRVTFITTQGGFTGSGDLDEKGHYTAKAPVGEVQISVDNRMLGGAAAVQGRRGGAGGPAKKPMLKRPDDTEGAHAMKGTYMSIPEKYTDPTTSGLTYTVKSEAQTHDIDLD